MQHILGHYSGLSVEGFVVNIYRIYRHSGDNVTFTRSPRFQLFMRMF
jgi:hypothetical protein